MIYIQLMGGLCNICFQIATALALGWDNNDNEIIISDYSQSITKRDEKNWFNTIFKNIKSVSHKPSNIVYVYKEPNFMYNKINYIKNMQIFGYFQSEKYFHQYRERILDFFLDYKNNIQDYLNNILNKNSNLPKISIHVRRTDYIKLQHYHTLLDENYYKLSVDTLSQKLNLSINELYDKYEFIIFSDDISWCKNSKFFNSFKHVYFMEENNDVHELYLMSMCDHNIIANSSFSWWSSYLNNNSQHITIAPKKWFNGRQTGGKGPSLWNDIYCKNWIII